MGLAPGSSTVETTLIDHGGTSSARSTVAWPMRPGAPAGARTTDDGEPGLIVADRSQAQGNVLASTSPAVR